METKLTLQQMMLGLHDLTAEELLQLNKQLAVMYKAKARIKRQVVATDAVVTGKFQVGDIIRFYKSGRGKNSGYNYFKFDHMNRAGDCMQGPACDKDGRPYIGLQATKWTVALIQPTLEVVFRNGKPYTA